MSFYLPREHDKDIRERYEGYRRRCESEEIAPVPFRSWAIIDAEYDIEWAAAQMEYDVVIKAPH